MGSQATRHFWRCGVPGGAEAHLGCVCLRGDTSECGTRMTRTPPDDRRRLTGGALWPQEGILRQVPGRRQDASGICALPMCLVHRTCRRCALVMRACAHTTRLPEVSGNSSSAGRSRALRVHLALQSPRQGVSCSFAGLRAMSTHGIASPFNRCRPKAARRHAPARAVTQACQSVP